MTPMFQTTETVLGGILIGRVAKLLGGTTERGEVWILAHGLGGISEPWWRRHGGTAHTQTGGTERRRNLCQDNEYSRDCLWGVRQEMLLGVI